MHTPVPYIARDRLPRLNQSSPIFENRVIIYTPSNSLATYDWQCGLCVLNYLLTHPGERMKILQEANRRCPHKPKTFRVYHPHVGGELTVNSYDKDNIFVHGIRNLARKYRAYCQITHQCPETPATITTPIIPSYTSLPSNPFTPISSSPILTRVMPPLIHPVPCKFALTSIGMVLVPLSVASSSTLYTPR